MFIREKVTKNRKTGTSYTKHQLVRSVRHGSSVRQEIVMELGKLDIDASQWKKLAQVLSMRIAGSESLFEADTQLSQIANDVLSNYSFIQGTKSDRAEIADKAEFVNVDLSSVAASQVRSLGGELIATTFYDSLGLGQELSRLGFDETEAAIAKAVITARLVAPGSDLSTHRWLVNNSSISELVGHNFGEVGKDAIYEIADALYENKGAIESALINKQDELFPCTRRLFLFDLTNAYFEGRTLGNSLAQYGHSKEKRYDCTLVSLALLVDDRGLPIYSRIYGGNQSEPETLQDVLEAITNQLSQGLFIQDTPTVVMDKTIATKDNIKLIESYNLRYLVITRSDAAKHYVEELKEDRASFTEIKTSDDEAVFIKKMGTPTNQVLCISERRGKKEEAMANLRTSRFIADFEKLNASVKKGQYTNVSTVERRIGKLTNEYRSIARRYEITTITNEKGNVTDLTLAQKAVVIDAAKALYGAYVIETNRNDLSPEEIWKLYMTLTRVEGAFRALKSDLGLRPIYHQLARRTAAHLFISVLAYHLYASIALTLTNQGDTRSVPMILSQVATHSRLTVMLCDDKNQIHHLRISSTPDPQQREIYSLLGIRDHLGKKKKVVAQL